MTAARDQGEMERTRRLTVAALLMIAQLFTALGLAASLSQIGPGTPICHVELSADGSPGPDHAPDQAPDIACTLCPFCAALHAVGLAPAPVALEAPTLVGSVATSLPPARAPPALRARRAHNPTGPPDLA